MKIRTIATIVCASLCLSLSAQEEIITTASSFIKDKQYAEADSYLDTIIRHNPQCVDALMMKGNVIFNKSIGSPSVSIDADVDHSVYDNTIATMGDYPRIVDKETARSIEKLWKKCLEIDPSRLDIYQGLCTLYGMALMKEEVIKILPLLIKAAPDKTDQVAYGCEDYAMAFEQRHDIDGCMAVYKKIQELFPACGGIVGDIAVMYQKHGMVKDCVKYARLASSMKGNDFLTCYVSASMISLDGNIDEGTKIFTSSRDTSLLFTYYKGIIQFYHNDPAWTASLKTFLAGYRSKDPDDGHIALAKVMTADGFKLDSAGYAAAMAVEPYELEYLLLSLKAKDALTAKYDPMFHLANLYARKQFFDRALPVFTAIEAMPKTPEQDSACHFYMAYTEYQAGKKIESVAHWRLFTSAGSFLRQSAACYFLGSIYMDQGKKKEAQELFRKVSSRASESKFANFCRWQVKE